MSLKKFLLWAAWLVLAQPAARSAALPPATSPVALKKQVLDVSATWIDNQLDFVNESNAEVTQQMVYALPQYRSRLGSTSRLVEPGFDPEKPRWHRFAVEVDGKPVPFQRTVDAIYQGRSIKTKLQQLGLNEDQIAYGSVENFGAIKQLSAGQVRQLVALGLMTGKPDRTSGAYWSVKVSYTWQQKFLPHQSVHVGHKFAPNVVRGLDEVPRLAGFSEKYCADKNFITGWNKLRTHSGRPVNAFFVSHLLAGSPYHVIEDFTLKLRKNFADDLVTLCFPGKVKKIGEMQYQLHLQNFRPVQDLEVYFGAGELGRGAG
ncbi:DUF4424 family protein [Massilia sp. TSP1-1-2]|uniref:DUF4424 family protein n=1 Tax=Massilia sp. TSP1-1-2 TaxID=2804649 RepID=UPI003CE817F8